MGAMTKSSTDPVFEIARQRINKLLKKIPATEAPLSPALVHSLRVCTKRLRALLQLYRPVASKTAIKKVDQPIKAIAGAYAGQRDSAVQYATLCHLVELYQQSQNHDLQPLLSYYAIKQERVEAEAAAPDPGAAFTAVIEIWKARLKGRQVPDFESGLEYAYRKARKLAYEAESSDDDEVYHQCRKWTKYYLYQLQMLVDSPRPKEKALIKHLKTLGILLGEFHDRCVLEQSLNRLLDKTVNDEPLEQAALLMLTWLMEQKRLDKKQCQEWFEGVFSRPHNPVRLKR
mgnify:CR=1 FL=1